MEKKDLATLLKKADKLKLVNKALYSQLFDAAQKSSRVTKAKLKAYIDKLEHLIKNKIVSNKTHFRKIQVVAPNYVSVEVSVKDYQVVYKAKKVVPNAWRSDLGLWSRPYDEPITRFTIENIMRRGVSIDQQVKERMLQNWFFESDDKGFLDSGMGLVITPQTVISHRITSTRFEETNLNDMSLLRARPITYKFIEADFTPLTDADECVIDNLHARYGNHLNLSRESLKAELDTIKKNEANIAPRIKNAMESGSGDTIYIYLDSWIEKDDGGYTTSHIATWCELHGIGMYAFAQDKVLFNRIKRDRHDLPVLVFFVASNHMYLITNQSYIDSVYRRYAERTLTSSEVLSENIKAENIYDGTIVTNLSYADLNKAKDCVVIYDTHDLRDLVIELYKKEHHIYKTKNQGVRIIEIEYKDNVHIRLNPNCDVAIHDRKMNHNDVKEICSKLGLEFKNQSISGLASQLKDKMLNCKAPRRLFTPSERKEVKEKYNHKCAECLTTLTHKFQIDHKIPIASGGSNDLSNLQLLCCACHSEKTKKEREAGDYMIHDRTKSSFNPKVEQVVFSDLNKHWAFIETVGNINARGIKHLDIVKSRRNKMLNNKYDYPIFTVMDDIKPFSGEVKCGLYYIECTAGFPLRGNGFYYQPLVEKALKKKIITHDMIKYELIPSIKLPADTFNELIYTIMNSFGDVAKMAVNALIGTLGKTMFTVNNSHFTKSAKEAGYFGLKFNMNAVPIEEDLFMIYSSAERKIAETSLSIYDMVIDMEIVELYTLTEIIKEHGGKVVALMTDCVSYAGKKFDLSPYKWKDGPKYRYEKKTNPKYPERMANYIRKDKYEDFNFDYKVIHDVPDKNFSPLVKQVLESKKGAMIDARAGCGKTTLVNAIKSELDSTSYASLAPTNKAARLLGKDAMTIHRFYNKVRKTENYVKNIKYIFIDEVSMMKEFFYHFFLQLKGRHDITFILSGDWRQCQPVQDRFKGSYKNSYALHHLVDGNLVSLTKCRRSDDRLFNLSLDCDAIDITQFKTDKKIMKHVCYYNETRKRINDEMMTEFIKMKNVRDVVYPLKKDASEQSQDVRLCRGMPVISRVNNDKYDIFSNETWVVKKILHGEVFLYNVEMVEGVATEIEGPTIELKEFQKLFNVAFCITVDRSQGSTFTEPYKIHDWERMDIYHKYTAVTRGERYENLFFA